MAWFVTSRDWKGCVYMCLCVCVCVCARVACMRKREKENSEVPQQRISNFNVHSWEPPKIL